MTFGEAESTEKQTERQRRSASKNEIKYEKVGSASSGFGIMES